MEVAYSDDGRSPPPAISCGYTDGTGCDYGDPRKQENVNEKRGKNQTRSLGDGKGCLTRPPPPPTKSLYGLRNRIFFKIYNCLNLNRKFTSFWNFKRPQKFWFPSSEFLITISEFFKAVGISSSYCRNFMMAVGSIPDPDKYPKFRSFLQLRQPPWGPSDPNNFDGMGENCVHIAKYGNGSANWNDQRCDAQRTCHICKKPLWCGDDRALGLIFDRISAADHVTLFPSIS